MASQKAKEKLMLKKERDEQAQKYKEAMLRRKMQDSRKKFERVEFDNLSKSRQAKTKSDISRQIVLDNKK